MRPASPSSPNQVQTLLGLRWTTTFLHTNGEFQSREPGLVARIGPSALRALSWQFLCYQCRGRFRALASTGFGVCGLHEFVRGVLARKVESVEFGLSQLAMWRSVAGSVPWQLA